MKRPSKEQIDEFISRRNYPPGTPAMDIFDDVSQAAESPFLSMKPGDRLEIEMDHEARLTMTWSRDVDGNKYATRQVLDARTMTLARIDAVTAKLRGMARQLDNHPEDGQNQPSDSDQSPPGE